MPRRIFHFFKRSSVLRRLIIINVFGIALPVIIFTVLYIRNEERRQTGYVFEEMRSDVAAEIAGIKENVVLLRNAGYYISQNRELVDYLSGFASIGNDPEIDPESVYYKEQLDRFRGARE